jgi:hypothetical protein
VDSGLRFERVGLMPLFLAVDVVVCLWRDGRQGDEAIHRAENSRRGASRVWTGAR